jgi:hypothetical protein
MVRIAGARSTGARATSGDPSPSDQESLGDLVALAARDVSQLIRYEIDLAKSELRADVKRAAMAGALFGFAAFIGCLVLVLLTFALAYGLKAAGIPGGGGLYMCFIYAAIICVLVAGALVAAAIFGTKKFSGMRQTRKTVTEDLGMLRRRDANGSISAGSAGGGKAAVTGDGPAAVTGPTTASS